MTKNAQAMGITVPSLSSLFDSLDKPTPKGLKTITRKAWAKLHAKRIAKVSAQVTRVELPAIKHVTLTDAFEEFEKSIAKFITMAVDKQVDAVVQSSQAENDWQAIRIQELENQLSELQIIVDVARKENRFVALTKKFFHGK